MRHVSLAVATLVLAAAPAFAESDDPWDLAKGQCTETKVVDVRPAKDFADADSAYEMEGLIRFENGNGLSYSGDPKSNTTAQGMTGHLVKVCQTGPWKGCKSNFYYSVTDTSSKHKMSGLYAVGHCGEVPGKG